VAALLEVRNGTLIYHLYRTPEARRYVQFSIPKKSGGTRTIYAPRTSIKILQRKLNFILQSVYTPKACVHGFSLGRSVVTNAAKHSEKSHVFNIDLQDFFPSINFGRVRGMLRARPYNLPDDVATVLAQICCFQNQLPQGAPTSPIVSNMVCSRLDTRLQRLAQVYRCTYTRYADDITFSTTQNRFPNELAFLDYAILPPKLCIGKELLEAIAENGFAINMKKARLQLTHNRHEVTGLTSNRFPNVQRKYINQLRAMIHAWRKYGYDAAETEFAAKYSRKHRGPFKGVPHLKDVIRGKLNYLSMVRGSLDPLFVKHACQLAELDPEYRVIYDFKVQRQLDRNNPHNAVWVLEGRDHQGTAFFLENTGFVTCWHVLEAETVAFRPQSHTKRFPIDPTASDQDIDLATFQTGYPDPVSLKKGDSNRLRIGDPVRVLGFPNYDLGHTIQEFQGHVTGFKQLFGSRRIMVDAPIIKGNSGGPVLNGDSEVIGVAYRGSDRMEEKWENESGVTPIASLDLLQSNA
jgi:RNA-directed DNA polymerase